MSLPNIVLQPHGAARISSWFRRYFRLSSLSKTFCAGRGVEYGFGKNRTPSAAGTGSIRFWRVVFGVAPKTLCHKLSPAGNSRAVGGTGVRARRPNWHAGRVRSPARFRRRCGRGRGRGVLGFAGTRGIDHVPFARLAAQASSWRAQTGFVPPDNGHSTPPVADWRLPMAR